MKTRYEQKRTSSVKEYNQRKKELQAIKNLFERNKLSKALSEINKYIEKYPEDYFGKFLAGNIYLAVDDYEKAEELFIEVSESDSNNRNSALVCLGKLNESRCNIPYARYYYETAITQSDYLEEYSIISLARIERQEENYSRAEEVLELIKEHRKYKYLLELSKVKRESNDIIEASILLSQIPKTEDEDFNREVSLERARVEIDFSCYEEAEKYLQEVKNVKNKDILYLTAMYEEAVIAYKKNDYALTENILRKLVKHKVYLGEKVTILLAKSCEKQSKIRVAKRKYKKAMTSTLKSVRVESAYTLANILLEEAEYDEAKDLYELVKIERPEYTKQIYYKLLAITIRKEDYIPGKYILKLIDSLNENNKNEDSYKLAEAIIDSKLNENPKETTSYIEKQIYNYNPIYALEKIKLTTKNNKINHEELFYTISNYFDLENKVNSELMDVYEINYNQLGYESTNEYAKVKVTVVPNTNNIVMIEFLNEKTLKDSIKYDKKTRVIKESDKVLLKEKHLSQLDKFMKKYNFQKK